MRSFRAPLLVFAALALAACTSAAPGWTYAPAPPATPIPSTPASAAPSAPASGAPVSPEPTTTGSAEPSTPAGGTVIELTAVNIAFDKSELAVPADQPFQIVFTNNDAGIPHNVAIHEGSPTGPAVWTGEIFNGVETRTYDVPALPAGAYGFVCTVHPNMTGTLTAE